MPTIGSSNAIDTSRTGPLHRSPSGMEATLKDIPFIVIGMIKYVSHQSGPGWEESYDWISFQLYSPTHGYVWLTWNKGHYLFSYRTRDMPHSDALPDRLVQKMDVKVEDRTFKMFEGYVGDRRLYRGRLSPGSPSAASGCMSWKPSIRPGCSATSGATRSSNTRLANT